MSEAFAFPVFRGIRPSPFAFKCNAKRTLSEWSKGAWCRGLKFLQPTMASGLAKWAGELAKGVHGYWANGRWTPLAISARHRAKIRKETLLAGGEWPYDAPRKPERTRMKGHKVDREAALKRARTVELMEKMPQMLADMKKRRWERKAEKK